MNYKICAASELSQTQKEEAVGLFVNGFYNIFSMGVSGDKAVLRQLFIDAFDYNMVYVCIMDDKVVGFLGLANAEKRPVSLSKEICKQLLGRFKGALIYKQMGDMLHKVTVREKTQGYIDYITTDAAYRGKGVATKLIQYICGTLPYESYTLEVLSKNTKAKHLYEKLGFVQIKEKKNLFVMLGGLGSEIVMRLTVKE